MGAAIWHNGQWIALGIRGAAAAASAGDGDATTDGER
jgi:hypothetical protein